MTTTHKENVYRACVLYNAYTSPWELRNDKERARNVRAWLHLKARHGRVTGDFWESENGRMISNH